MSSYSKIEEQKLVSEAELPEHLLSTLSALPRLEILEYDTEVKLGSHRYDLVLKVDCSGRVYKIFAEVNNRALHPKTALGAVRQLHDCDGVKMLGATSLTQETRAVLREQGISYWDLSGSVYLNLPNDYYFIDKPPLPQPREGREPKKVFKGSTAQVIHTVLLDPKRLWKVTELAKEAGVSAYTSQKVLEYLEAQLWLKKEGRGPQTIRRLTQPGKLLDAWADAYDPDHYRLLKFYKYSKTEEEQIKNLESLMKEAKSPWALTLEHGVKEYAPFINRLPSALTALVSAKGGWSRRATEEGFKSVSSGENFRLLVSKTDTPLLGRQQFGLKWVASPIQLYLDLFSWPQRGKEQAEHLREKRIGF